MTEYKKELNNQTNKITAAQMYFSLQTALLHQATVYGKCLKWRNIMKILTAPGIHTGCSRKTAQSLMHCHFMTVSHSHAVFTKMFRNYSITHQQAKFEQCY